MAVIFPLSVLLLLLLISHVSCEENSTQPNVSTSDTTSTERSSSTKDPKLTEKAIRVTTILNEPFVMYKKKWEALNGNDRFEGYMIDVLDHVAKIVNFTYMLHIVADGHYGSKYPNNVTWNGMVGELIRGQADMAAGDLTKTYERGKVIDFSAAFMYTGITILFKRKEGEKMNFFQLFTPFSNIVWFFLILGEVSITLLLWLLAKYSPAERDNEPLCLIQSLWTVTATFLQQGVSWSPRSVSTRFLLMIWWLFALVIIASYTANLAAFLSVQRTEIPFNSVDELAAQDDTPYGTLKFSSMMDFFNESHIATYQHVWEYLQKNRDSLIEDEETATAKVIEGNFAYFGESAWSEYLVAQHCNLMTVGGLINSEVYGLGFPKGSKLTKEVSKAILYMTDNSILIELKEKWWSGSKECQNTADGTIDSMGLQSSIGIFVLLGCGAALALVGGICEWIKANFECTKREKVLNFGQHIQDAPEGFVTQ